MSRTARTSMPAIPQANLQGRVERRFARGPATGAMPAPRRPGDRGRLGPSGSSRDDLSVDRFRAEASPSPTNRTRGVIVTRSTSRPRRAPRAGDRKFGKCGPLQYPVGPRYQPPLGSGAQGTGLVESSRDRLPAPVMGQRLPRRSCSISIASKSALKLPTPKPREPWRSMISKKNVGRSCTGRVKICSR